MLLTRWTARRRADDLELLDQFNRRIMELDTAVEQAAAQGPVAQLLGSLMQFGFLAAV